MIRKQLPLQDGPAKSAGFTPRHLTRIITSLAASALLGSLIPDCLGQVAPPSALNPGDVVYTDSGNAIQGGFVIRVDAATGQSSVISSGGLLSMPFGVTVDGSGQVIVSDSGRLLRIDPQSGAQSVLADNSQGTLGLPYGLDLNRSGDIVAANLAGIIQVDPATGQVQTLSSGGYFGYPLGVAVAPNGQLFVLNIGSARQLLRINPQTGAQHLVSQGGYFINPQTIAIDGNDIYVTDVATPDGNFGIGRVIHVDAQSGAQTIVAQGHNLVGPVGIAVDGNGQLIVGDPYTVNTNSVDLVDGGYDGAVIRVDPATGNQTVLARGQAGYVNPRGVAIVPTLSSTATVK